MATKKSTTNNSWKTPMQRFRQRLKYGELSMDSFEETSSSPSFLSRTLSETSNSLLYENSTTKECKRFNPFKRGIHLKVFKRIRSHKNKENDNPEGSVEILSENALHGFPQVSIFSHIENIVSTKDNQKSLQGPTDFSSINHMLCNDNATQSKIENEDNILNQPLDLYSDERLGTKIHVKSNIPFPWMPSNLPGRYPVRTRGSDLDLATRCLFKTVYKTTEGFNDTFADSSSIFPLLASTMYWQFPELPWLKTFPCLEKNRKYSAEDFSSKQLPSKHLDALNIHWCEALDHLYNSWRKHLRHSFYICCSTLTVLFTWLGKNHLRNSPGHRVVIFPSSSTLQQCLNNEDIAFDLVERKRTHLPECSPVHFIIGDEKDSAVTGVICSQPFVSSKNAFCDHESTNKTQSLDDENDSSDEKMSSMLDDAWLMKIGVSPSSAEKIKRRSSLNSMSHSTENLNISDRHSQSAAFLSGEHFTSDRKNQSTIFICDAMNIQALFNLIMERKICTSSQAGLPPTLLSSQPFLFSALKTLSKTSFIQKNGDKNLSILTLKNGPVMPHMLPLLNDYLKSCKSLKKDGNKITVEIIGRDAYPSTSCLRNSENSDFSSFQVFS